MFKLIHSTKITTGVGPDGLFSLLLKDAAASLTNAFTSLNISLY